MNITTITNLILVVGISGCAIYKDGAGQDQVARALKERYPLTVENPLNEADLEVVRERLRDGLSEEDVDFLVLATSPGSRELIESLGFSQADFLAGSIPDNPSISIERRWSGKSLEVDVTQNILSLVLLTLRRDVAKREFEAQKFLTISQLSERLIEARTLFWDYIAQLKLLEVEREFLENARSAELFMTELHRAGNAPLMEVKRFQAARARAQLTVAAKELEAIKLKEGLNSKLGLYGIDGAWQTATTLTEPDVTVPPSERIEVVALLNRPELSAAKEQLLGAAKAVGVANIESVIPDLTLTSHYEMEPAGDESIGPSVEFGVPIFDFGSVRRGRARAALRVLQARYQELATEIRAEARKAYAEYDLAKARAKFISTELLPLEGAHIREAVLQYNTMSVGPMELLERQQSQLEAKREEVEALRDCRVAVLNLFHAVGTTELAAETVTGEKL